jgi:predicted HAD superfamily Cof-like phosphohydrolase
MSGLKPWQKSVLAHLGIKNPTYTDKVREFANKFRVDMATIPIVPLQEVMDFRTTLLSEEFHEYLASYEKLKQIQGQPFQEVAEMENLVDALVDLVYVAIGTCLVYGVDFDKAFNEVHRANMSKVRAKHASQSKRGSSYDVVKPPGWVGPDHFPHVGGVYRW